MRRAGTAKRMARQAAARAPRKSHRVSLAVTVFVALTLLWLGYTMPPLNAAAQNNTQAEILEMVHHTVSDAIQASPESFDGLYKVDYGTSGRIESCSADTYALNNASNLILNSVKEMLQTLPAQVSVNTPLLLYPSVPYLTWNATILPQRYARVEISQNLQKQSGYQVLYTADAQIHVTVNLAFLMRNVSVSADASIPLVSTVLVCDNNFYVGSGLQVK